MIKKTKIKVPAHTKIEERRICDFCKERAISSCDICERDVCYNHREYYPGGWDDYAGGYCPICLELRLHVYDKDFEEVRAAYEQDIKDLAEEVKTKSLEEDPKKVVDNT